MKKVATKNLPLSIEINKAANHIKSQEFLMCTRFADTLIRYIEITMKKNRVSRLQGQALHFLVLQGGQLTPTKLARMMFRSKHSMTKIIDILEKQGLIVRDFSDKDRRVTQIKITSIGLDYVTSSFNKGNELGKQVMDSLDVTERKLLVNLTERLRKKMTEAIRSLS